MKTADAHNAPLTGFYEFTPNQFRPEAPSLPKPLKGQIVGVCGKCGGDLRELPIFDTTYRHEYAKCEDCGCFHGQLPANGIETKTGLHYFDMTLFWNPVL